MDFQSRLEQSQKNRRFEITNICEGYLLMFVTPQLIKILLVKIPVFETVKFFKSGVPAKSSGAGDLTISGQIQMVN